MTHFLTKKISRGWSAFAIGLALCFLITAVDHVLKSVSNMGYCPEDTDWTAFAEDLPFAWETAAQSSAAAVLAEEVPLWMHPVELTLRNAAGIRPNPSRWRVWMGPKMLAGGKSGQWGFCVCPGLLMRLVHGVNCVVHPAEDGLCRYGEFYYAWRGRFLIISRWPEYVRASLDAEKEAEPPKSVSRDGIHLAWNGPIKGEMCVRAKAPHLQGRLDLALPPAPDGLQLPEAWPEPPMVSVTASSLKPIVANLYPLLEKTPAYQSLLPYVLPVWKRWNVPPLPDAWDQNVLEYSWTLLSVDTAATLPVPRMALAFRMPLSSANPHPLMPLIASEDALPSSWGGHPGWILPWLGEKLSLCLTQTDGYALVTSQEPLMARLAGRMTPHPVGANALAIQVDWAKTGECVAALLRQAAQLELIPGKDSRDVEQDYIPATRALSRLGALCVEASSDGTTLNFSGTLFSEEGTAP